MSIDIRPALEEWDFDPQNNARVVTGNDGRLILQVRLPLGIEQYEIDGRPDGLMPEGRPTWLDVAEAHAAADPDWRITPDDFVKLQNEAIIFYYRYMQLFQLNDFERVERDTGHNLRLSTLVEERCDDEENRQSVLQFRPYVIRIHTMARAMLAVQQNRITEAIEDIEAAILRIEALDPVITPAFQFERTRSLTYLRATLEQLRIQAGAGEGAVTDIDRIRAALDSAVETEDYEEAARLRDRLRQLIDKATTA